MHSTGKNSAFLSWARANLFTKRTALELIILYVACWLEFRFLLLALAVVALRRLVDALPSLKWLQCIVEGDAPSPARSVSPPNRKAVSQDIACFLACAAFIVVGFTFLEWRDPYYFTQDDNFFQGLPLLLQCFDSVFSGVFPEWNPYQAGGEPTTSSGILGITYPVSLAAYGIARFVLGDANAMLEVQAFFHLLLAGLGAYWAGRQWRVPPALALAVAVGFAFSGFLLTIGRGWSNFLSASAWIPVFVGLVAPAQLNRITWKWVLAMGLVTGVSFHTGFIQLWVYTIAFCGIIVLGLLAVREIPWRSPFWAVPAGLLGLAVAAPLLWVQMDFVQGMVREFERFTQEFSWDALPAMLWPGEFDVSTRLQWVASRQSQFYSFGSLFVLACCLLAVALPVSRWNRRVISQNILFFCAVIALLFSLGENSPVPLASWANHLPGFSNFRWPWRAFIFVTLFASLGGAAAIARVCASVRRGPALMWTVTGVALCLVAYNVMLPHPPLSPWKSKPYPPFNADLARLLKANDAKDQQRSLFPLPLCEISPCISSEGFQHTLLGNFPTLYEVLSFGRYNTLTWYHPFSGPLFRHFNVDPIRSCQAYGVRWLVHSPGTPIDVRFTEGLGAPKTVAGMRLWQIPDAAPLAFAAGEPRAGYPLRFSTKGATVHFGPQGFSSGGTFVVNILAWPDFNVHGDGQSLPFKSDEWGRLVVDLPAGVRNLEIVYRPPWSEGFLLAAALLAASLVSWAILAWFNKHGPTPAIGVDSGSGFS